MFLRVNWQRNHLKNEKSAREWRRDIDATVVGVMLGVRSVFKRCTRSLLIIHMSMWGSWGKSHKMTRVVNLCKLAMDESLNGLLGPESQGTPEALTYE